jgi:acyl-coenzyme A synthetase/AMP-(fatty) acid ligase
LLALDKVSEVSVVGRINGETGDVVAVFVVLGAVEGSVSMVVDEVRIWVRLGSGAELRLFVRLLL